MCMAPGNITVCLDGAFDQLVGDSNEPQDDKNTCASIADGSKFEDECSTCDLDARVRVYEVDEACKAMDRAVIQDQGILDVQTEPSSSTAADDEALEAVETESTSDTIAKLPVGHHIIVAL